eukprot:SAG31_NODE_16930_length_690_cov_0.773266_1_plen_27_part_10
MTAPWSVLPVLTGRGAPRVHVLYSLAS